MQEQWTLEKINQLITDQVQENLNLEYKSSGALGKTEEKRKEITKDISAMANSDGGIIIYGIKEHQDNKQFPEIIEPINPKEYSKEWLEQVINIIRPKIDGIIITPIIANNENFVVYIVIVPKGDTAHQAQDLRYYKRFNFSSIPMQDYEIRDVMGRNQNPKFELSFCFERMLFNNSNNNSNPFFNNHPNLNDERKEMIEYSLYVTLKNSGSVYAKYVNAIFLIPWFIVDYEIDEEKLIKEDDILYYRDYEDNTTRDVVGYNHLLPQYGPSWFDPILPGLSRTWKIRLKNLGEVLPTGRFNVKDKLKWTIYADNTIPQIGEIQLVEIDIKYNKEPPHA
jgi:hypothetical protein